MDKTIEVEHKSNITLVKSHVEKDDATGRWKGMVIVEIGEQIILIERLWFAQFAADAWCRDLESKFYNETSVTVVTIQQSLLKRIWSTLRK